MNGSLEMARTVAARLVELCHESPVAPEQGRVVVCPPYLYLGMVGLKMMDSTLLLGAQDCSTEQKGAFTGQVSAAMLKDLGCSYVIVGHSERRTHLHETNLDIQKKAEQAVLSGLTPIICVGESWADREAGNAKEIVLEQVRASLPHLDTSVEKSSESPLCILAYEPVWAIGTGKVPTEDQIQEIHDALDDAFKETPVLYGGSVNADNAKRILDLPHVGGLLVGGASLDPETFWKIAQEV